MSGESGYEPQVEADSRVCLACGATPEPGAHFCARCGRPLDDEAAIASPGMSRRVFGAVSADALFVAGCIFLAVALVASIVGSWVFGVVLLAPALALLALFASVARETGRSTVAQTALRAGYRARGWAALGGRAVGAWGGAGRDVMRLRRESRALRRARLRRQLELGDAAFREDEEEVASLRARIHEIDRGLAERDRARGVAVADARRRVEDERAGAQRTRQLTLDNRDSKTP